jgi:hypothetical protein
MMQAYMVHVIPCKMCGPALPVCVTGAGIYKLTYESKVQPRKLLGRTNKSFDGQGIQHGWDMRNGQNTFHIEHLKIDTTGGET